MREDLVEMRYFETYYYANVIGNILDSVEQWVVELHKWHENIGEDLIQPFSKWSALHSISAHVIRALLEEKMSEDEVNGEAKRSFLEVALQFYELDCPKLLEYLDTSSRDSSITVEDYHEEVRTTGVLEELVEELAEEVFQLLFLNRKLLWNLHLYLANSLWVSVADNLHLTSASLFESPCRLIRKKPPSWARKAVFHRDKGRCTMCKVDLSGRISLNDVQHFDHIIPLKMGGLNDVSNLQLLCITCNLRKGKSLLQPSLSYERWF